MKIASIHVEHFLGAAAVHVETRAPVQLFCGPNAAGKSSIRDAVALALTGDLGRVGLKKEAAQLITEGAEGASIELVDADGDAYAVSISKAGRMTTAHKREPSPVIAYALDAQRFASLGDTERRQFLVDLVGVKMDPAAIKDRLITRVWAGHKPSADDLKKLDRVAPLLRAGFDGAAKEAKAQATTAKGAWRGVTGETYGSEKAKSWRAAVPAYDAAALKDAQTQITHADAALETWQREAGSLEREEQHRAKLRASLPPLQEHAAKLPRLQAKLDTDDASMQAAEQELARVSAAAGGRVAPRVGLLHELAKAAHFIVALQSDSRGVVGYHMNGDTAEWDEFDEIDQAAAALKEYEREHGPINADATGDPEARARLPELTAQRDLMVRAVANSQRDLQAARDAKAQADAIAAELAETFDADALANAREQIETIKRQRAEHQAKADRLRSLKDAADAAEAKTRDAAAHAADVATWDAIGDALGPDGILADILADALGPVNDRLAQHAADTGWPAVRIGGDMAITADGRAYRLLSESERWRVDAMVAECIAHLSGLRLLVLDRMDVLDLPARGELLGWLDTLADLGELDTALVFATLKAMPANLPATIDAHWLQAGTVARLAEAA